MKLRNKKTGEIVGVESLYLTQTQELYLLYINEENNERVYMTDKIASFNLDWEDYEEPKKYWFIDIRYPKVEPKKDINLSNSMRKRLKEIGNYFETKEEAEKAVEKLKAITRLNKCGFKFEGYTDRDRASGGDIVIYAHVDIPNNNLLEEAQPDMLKDLDLLFGGEK